MFIVSYCIFFLWFPGVAWLKCHRNTCKHGCVRPSKNACRHDQMWKDRLQSGRAGEHSSNLYARASAYFTERTFQYLLSPLRSLSFTREACCGFEPGQSWEDLNSQIAQGPLPRWQHCPSHCLRETLKRNTNGEFGVEMWSIQLAPSAVCSILFFVRN